MITGLLLAPVVLQLVLVPLSARLLRRRGASLGQVVVLALVSLVTLSLVLSLSALLHWPRERALVCALTFSCAALAATAGMYSRRHRRLGGMALGLSIWLNTQGVWCALAISGALHDPSTPAVRMALVLPAALMCCGIFGASLALVGHDPQPGGAAGGWRLPTTMAWRLLLSPGGRQGRRISPVLATVTQISGVGVALGVWLVLVALGILAGFEHDLTDKIMGSSAHVHLTRADGAPFDQLQPILDAVLQVPGVVGAVPVVESEVAMASPTNYVGGQLIGLDVKAGRHVLPVLEQITPTAADALAGPCSPLCAAVIGAELAHSLGLDVGARMRLISATQVTLSPLGPLPKTLGLRIVGTVASKMYEFDSRTVFVGADVAQRFASLGPDNATGIQVALADADAVDGHLAALLDAVQGAAAVGPLEAQTWKARNQALFAALALERIVAAVVLAFIILVASFAIVNTLTMHILARRWEIAMMRAMGASDSVILRTFVIVGLCIGGAGTLAGASLGVSTLMLLRRFGFGIPDEVYYIDALPVFIGAGDVVCVVLAGLLIVWDFAVWPSLGAAALRPVEGLRDG